MQPRLDAQVAFTSSSAHRGPKGDLLDTATYASRDWAMRNILRINVRERFSLGARSEAFRECRCQRVEEWKVEVSCRWSGSQDPHKPAG
jgi:hypothetical protein